MEIKFVDNSRDTVRDALEVVFSNATSARIAVAFARHSGVEAITSLRRLAETGGRLCFLAGVDFQLTDLDTLEIFNRPPASETRVFWRSLAEKRFNFHPKVYISHKGNEVEALVGSSNFTGGGLRSNVEANIYLRGVETEEPIRQVLRFHERLWGSPLSIPVTSPLRQAYSQLQDRRRTIEARLRREPDFERAQKETQQAVAEAVAASFPAGERNTWLLVTSPENYHLCRIGQIWGDEKPGRISKVRPGDLLAFYVTGSHDLRMLALVTSDVFEDQTPYWPGRIFPYRLNFLPLVEPEGFLPFPPLVKQLELFRGIDPKKYGQALQRSQISLSPRDGVTILEAILKAGGVPGAI